MRLVSAAVLALVILIPLAGCSGIFGPTAQEPSTFAPGVSNERVTDAATLAAANRAILQNTSYTYVRNYTQRVDTEGYHYAVNHDTRVWVGADGSFLYHHRGVVTGGEHPSEHIDGVWANGSIAVTRTINVRNGSVTYTRYRPPEPYSAANATHNDVSRALRGALVTTTWNESGTAYRRVHANTSETRRWQASNGTAVNLTTRRTATATIREDGLVSSLNTTVSGDRPLPVAANDSIRSNGRPIAHFRDQASVRYRELGTTDIPRPDWVDEALAATDGLSFGQTTAPRLRNASS
ncbi:hypothetical protein ACERIT_05145 [Halopenitus sp. H-Gu1]|uniref:hypothetical protein n=1 Tax=Halopenitus sp. H-Gu1 TaxID=3242697 RepID=UPI00359E0025